MRCRLEGSKNYDGGLLIVKHNRRVVLAGVLLLLTSALFALSAFRPNLTLPVAVGAILAMSSAFLVLFRGSSSRPRPI